MFTGLFDLKKPGEYPYLVMGESGASEGLRRGRPPADLIRGEVSFGELPAGCKTVVAETYRKLWGLDPGLGVKVAAGGNIGRDRENPSLEAVLDFDPNDAPRYLQGVEYPASKGDLISAAESNGAPEELVERLGTLSRPEFPGPEQVVEELESSPTSG